MWSGIAHAAMSGHKAGVYVDWGDPNGRESNVEAFEQWLGRKGLLALDYTPGDSGPGSRSRARSKGRTHDDQTIILLT